MSRRAIAGSSQENLSGCASGWVLYVKYADRLSRDNALRALSTIDRIDNSSGLSDSNSGGSSSGSGTGSGSHVAVGPSTPARLTSPSSFLAAMSTSPLSPSAAVAPVVLPTAERIRWLTESLQRYFQYARQETKVECDIVANHLIDDVTSFTRDSLHGFATLWKDQRKDHTAVLSAPTRSDPSPQDATNEHTFLASQTLARNDSSRTIAHTLNKDHTVVSMEGIATLIWQSQVGQLGRFQAHMKTASCEKDFLCYSLVGVKLHWTLPGSQHSHNYSNVLTFRVDCLNRLFFYGDLI